MSSVVLRCPNCGTTRGTLGRCDACHEADVKYFCTNHSPGRWLAGPTCEACGRRFGERPPAPAPAPRPAREAPQLPPEPPRRSPWRRRAPPIAEYPTVEAPRRPPVADVLAEILRRTGGMRRPPAIPDFGPPAGVLMVRGCFRTAFALFVFAILFLIMIVGGVVMQMGSGYW